MAESQTADGRTEFATHTKTAHAAALIEREAPRDIEVSHNRFTVKVDFGDKLYLPSKVPAVARDNGFVLSNVVASVAEFMPKDHQRVQL